MRRRRPRQEEEQQQHHHNGLRDCPRPLGEVLLLHPQAARPMCQVLLLLLRSVPSAGARLMPQSGVPTDAACLFSRVA